MKDGIIKGDGTSRKVKANFPPTYEEFKAKAASGELTLDIIFNALGWSQQPDFLNKKNLLKDETAVLYGVSSDAVPDDLFRKIYGITSPDESYSAENKWFTLDVGDNELAYFSKDKNGLVHFYMKKEKHLHDGIFAVLPRGFFDPNKTTYVLGVGAVTGLVGPYIISISTTGQMNVKPFDYATGFIIDATIPT